MQIKTKKGEELERENEEEEEKKKKFPTTIKKSFK